MYRLILVEDEILILNYMKKMIEKYSEFKIVGAFATPEEALSNFDRLKPDVVFLDVEMPRMSGIELARKMLDITQDIQVVFITAYSQYAIDAFNVEAIDYLMKPIDSDDIERVIKRLNKSEKKILNRDVHLDMSSLSSTKIYPVSCLGCFEVRNRENMMIKWPTKRAEEVFAYFLVHQNTKISKWSLLDLFWPDLNEAKGLNNLYSTIFRIKQVLADLPCSLTIKTINDGYLMESNEILSDMDLLKCLVNHEERWDAATLKNKEDIFLHYRAPLFGVKDYAWSISFQAGIALEYKKLCKQLLSYYLQTNNMEAVSKTLRQYALFHTEDEDMILQGLHILKSFQGGEKKIREFTEWINAKLSEMELPRIVF